MKQHLCLLGLRDMKVKYILAHNAWGTFVSMNNSSQPARKKLLDKRVGRALTQYFKPVRMAPPHAKEQTTFDVDSLVKPNFRLIKFKSRAQIKAEEDAVRVQQALDASSKPNQELADVPIPDKPITNWLDLVVYLLRVCRRVSQRLKDKAGYNEYQKMFLAKGSKKLKAVGSIIDATEKLDE